MKNQTLQEIIEECAGKKSLPLRNTQNRYCSLIRKGFNNGHKHTCPYLGNCSVQEIGYGISKLAEVYACNYKKK